MAQNGRRPQGQQLRHQLHGTGNLLRDQDKFKARGIFSSLRRNFGEKKNQRELKVLQL